MTTYVDWKNREKKKNGWSSRTFYLITEKELEKFKSFISISKGLFK